MTSWIGNLGNTWVGWILAGVGLALIGVAAVDIFLALRGKEKKWGACAQGVVVGLIGGLLAVWGSGAIISFFKGKGQEIPHS